jgi:hypothetical protein
MRALPLDSRVQARGCSAVWELAISSDAHRRCLCQTGAAKAVVWAMHTLPSSAPLQSSGCGALWGLGADAAVGQARGGDAVLRAMLAFPHNRHVQMRALGALTTLAAVGEPDRRLGEWGPSAYGALAHALHNFPNDDDMHCRVLRAAGALASGAGVPRQEMQGHLLGLLTALIDGGAEAEGGGHHLPVHSAIVVNEEVAVRRRS